MSESEINNKTLQIGDVAPDFTLPTHNEGELNLKWYRGRKNVVLAFYPGDWTAVCGNHIAQYKSIIEQLTNLDCQLFGISVNSIPSHIAWAKSLGGLMFPLMSDFYPHGEVCQKYGVFNEYGYSNRVVFLIDKKGIIRFIDDVDLSLVPDNEKLLSELAKLPK